MAIVGLLLLLASVNLATLLLARATRKCAKRESGWRSAPPGAGDAPISDRESAAGRRRGVLGALGARWAVRFLAQFVWTANIEKVHDVPLDGNVVAFTVSVAVIAGAIFA